ncbi:sulfotransferase [Sphingomonas sp. RB1R13]|uniref:sulfotransferase n=1 Tax=Sphingomonas sp. RB1R13 TaxID=3096159 RepID=UPI002FC589D3
MTLTARFSTDSEDRLRRAKGMLQNGRIAALGLYKSLLAKASHRLGVNLTLGHALKKVGKALKDRGDHVRLMDHWNAVLPGQVLRVDYRDVVTNFEPQVRRLLDTIGVPSDQGCLDFRDNEHVPEPVNMQL